jgi:hypothetical protein
MEGKEIIEEHSKAIAEKSKMISDFYTKVKPHISFLNDLVIFATFINTSYSILVLLVCHTTHTPHTHSKHLHPILHTP